jgi:hypothetical protein
VRGKIFLYDASTGEGAIDAGTDAINFTRLVCVGFDGEPRVGQHVVIDGVDGVRRKRQARSVRASAPPSMGELLGDAAPSPWMSPEDVPLFFPVTTGLSVLHEVERPDWSAFAGPYGRIGDGHHYHPAEILHHLTVDDEKVLHGAVLYGLSDVLWRSEEGVSTAAAQATPFLCALLEALRPDATSAVARTLRNFAWSGYTQGDTAASMVMAALLRCEEMLRRAADAIDEEEAKRQLDDTVEIIRLFKQAHGRP